MITVNATWPVDHLPDTLLAGTSVEYADPYIVSQTEAGRDIIRRRFTSIPEFHDVNFLMNQREMSVFEYFWVNELDYGGTWFNFPIADAVGYSNRICRFRGQYQTTPRGNNKYSVSCRLEIHTKQVITKAQYDRITKPGLFDWAVNGDWSTNGDWINVPRV